MTGRDAKTILVHGINTVLAGDNEIMGKAKSLPCENLHQAPATILFLMTESTMTFPEFEAGQVWRTRNGQLCRIMFIDQDKTCKYPICTDLRGGHWHHLDGKSCLNNDDDLVFLIGKPVLESPPTTSIPAASVTNALPAPMANGDVPFYVVVAIDPDGEKLVWETPIPEGATLEAALKRRLRMSSRYPVSCIAECRIIPLLTQQS
jgi:hypothetical protein